MSINTATVTLSRRQFAAALSRLNTTAPRKSPKAILQNARLSLSDRLELASTDMERQHTERVEPYETAGNAGGVDTLANVAELCRAVAASKASDVVIGFTGSALTVDGLRLSPPANVDEFPSIKHGFDGSIRTLGGVAIDAAEFARLLTLSAFCTDTTNSRYALGGVRIECAAGGELGGGIRLIATDGRRLSVAESSTPVAEYIPAAEPGAAPTYAEPVFGLWPAAAAELALRQLAKAAKAKTVVVELLQNFREVKYSSPAEPGAERQPLPVGNDADMVRLATFDADGNALSIVTARTIEGRYPNWRQVVPNNLPTHRGTVRVDALANVAKRCMAIAERDERGAAFTFRERLALVNYRTNNGRRVRDGLRLTPAASFGGALSIKLDVNFVGELAKAAAAAGVDSVDIYAENSTSPIVFELGAVACHIIMPMARNNGNESKAAKRKRRAERIDAENEAKADAAAELAALNAATVAV